MAKAKEKKGGLKRSAYYTISGTTARSTRRFCPRCGPGVFLGEHIDRVTCGKCGYTEFHKKD